ncbi:Hypp537 [Branchiostoma lanceolatum]|uniref:Hypp537 protein n=1 Tax=Branchiostoma lanceolatum TaxID=7740 RepID=A0A8J9W075_BRALA|nr:Hypp537 [Branchiostoma lanceolatum]
MAGRRSLSFGGGLSFRKLDDSGTNSQGSGSELEGGDSPDVGRESEASQRESVNIQGSPGQSNPHPPTSTPNGSPRNGRRQDLLAPHTVPKADRTALSRQLTEVLANQQQILRRMAKVEGMVEDMQKAKQRAQGAGEKQGKLEVPNDVRSLVRQGYELAINNDGKEKWNLAKGMKATSAVNSETMKAVHDYVQGLLLDYGDKLPVVKAAVDTYFATKARQEKRAAEGKEGKHSKACKRNTRKTHKLNCRKRALRAKQTYNTKRKEKLQRVLLAKYMSSEESGEDDNGEKIIKIRAIPWESDEFTKYKGALDHKFRTCIQTEQARRQSMVRYPGRPSTSNIKKPVLSEQDAWIAK